MLKIIKSGCMLVFLLLLTTACGRSNGEPYENTWSESVSESTYVQITAEEPNIMTRNTIASTGVTHFAILQCGTLWGWGGNNQNNRL